VKGVVKIRDLMQRTEIDVPREHVAANVRNFFSGA
jgi:hypothetical protein